MTLTLVTGAGGFLGRHVVDALNGRGERVRALDLAFDPPLPPPHAPQTFESLVGSVTDAAALANAMTGVETVVHLAAIAHLWTRDPKDYERINVAGAERVFEAAARAGVRRIVHVSSYVTLMAGRRGDGDRAVDETLETTEAAMLGPYPRSKWRAEAAARRFAEATQIETAIVLPSAPIGPGDWRLTPPSQFLRDLARRKLPATLDCRLNLIDVRALAAGIVAARDVSAQSWGGPWRRWLLTGEDVEMDAYLALVAEAAGVRTPRAKAPYAVALAAAQVEDRVSRLTGRAPGAPLTGVRLAGLSRRFSNARARAELGLAPPPLDRAVTDALTWMRGAGFLEAGA